MREATEDYKVPNSKHVIPKGATVWIPMIGVHFDEEFWTNPEKFDPERFTPEEIANRPNYTYLPFGDGPRNCIGMRYVRGAVCSI
jgi:cytochrome P450 family 6